MVANWTSLTPSVSSFASAIVWMRLWTVGLCTCVSSRNEAQLAASACQVPNQLFGQPYRVVLPTVMRVHLEHVGYEQPRDWCVKRRDVAPVVGRDNRLGERRTEGPRLAHPRLVEGWVDSSQEGCKAFDQFPGNPL